MQILYHMQFYRILVVIFASAFTFHPLQAGGIREHTRPDYGNTSSVNQEQANELTLTLVKTEQQSLQTWIRTAAVIDASKEILSAVYCPSELSNGSTLVRTGQRVRVFSADSKSSIYQARVTEITMDATAKQNHCFRFKVQLARPSLEKSHHYVLEIIVQRGRFLAIPKEAIIEEQNQKIVYVEHHPGHFMPQVISTGLKGELYTEILQGLSSGDRVVTLGSFFIDADYKLKSATQSGGAHAHHHH